MPLCENENKELKFESENERRLFDMICIENAGRIQELDGDAAFTLELADFFIRARRQRSRGRALSGDLNEALFRAKFASGGGNDNDPDGGVFESRAPIANKEQ